MTPIEGTLAPLYMILIACIFLVALDKVDTVAEYYKRSSIKNRLIIYAMVMLILQMIQLLLIGAIYLK
ncbi:MAG: hypothetical protein LRY68_10495 [Sulfurospirillum sp.]|nr:hypothetical protein [Sulfurospirillum sp.]